MEPAGNDATASRIRHPPRSGHPRAGDNANGFADGAWIPYLGVTYEITKEGGSQKIAGALMPMVASDGPHYGDNVKLAGPGKYGLRLPIGRPARHMRTSAATRTRRPVWDPGSSRSPSKYEFAYAGIGKKGGY